MRTHLGPFQLLEVVGRGGMGTVYRGLDPIIGRPVAVKVIRLVGYNDREEQGWLRDRLFREARAAGSLCHPGIVTIYQVGEENDVAYIAMEFVDGLSLQDILKQDGHKDKARLCQILIETAAALDYAHEHGLVHRDIKPANIMLSASGVTKVTDFGIAKTMLGQTATKTGMMIGTPFYMSPEQIRGKTLDGRSDQFSLAVVAYEIFTGRKPFHAEQLTSICYQIIHEEPLSPEDIVPDVGVGAAAVIKRGLSKDADSRYRTCTEFACELAAAVHRNGETAAPQLADELPGTPVPPAAVQRTRTSLLVTSSCLAVVTVVASSWALTSGRSAPAPPSTLLSAIAQEQQPNQKPSPLSEPETVPQRQARTEVQRASVPSMPPGPEPAVPAVATPVIEEPPQATIRTGMLVWTGQAMEGDVLTITGSHASKGTVSGTLPERPSRVQVYAAKLTADGLTVFTADPRDMNKVRRGAPVFTFDPRHATDVTVFETPGPQNDWKRLVIRVNIPISACVVEWQI